MVVPPSVDRRICAVPPGHVAAVSAIVIVRPSWGVKGPTTCAADEVPVSAVEVAARVTDVTPPSVFVPGGSGDDIAISVDATERFDVTLTVPDPALVTRRRTIVRPPVLTRNCPSAVTVLNRMPVEP